MAASKPVSIMEQKMSKIVSENPFYGSKSMLAMDQGLTKLDDKTSKPVVFAYLEAAWKEATTKEKKELFFILIFSMGDIQNREHNLFRKRKMKNVDQGGHSKRKVFLFCMEWVLTKIPQQFYAFLPIIGEYYNLDGMFFYELKTDRWKGTLLETIKLPIDVNLVTDYISKTLRLSRTTDNEKSMWAKWLPHVPTQRYRTYTMTEKTIKAFQKNPAYKDVKIGDKIVVKKLKKEHTLQKDVWALDFIRQLSEKMNWVIVDHPTNVEFKGYREFKTKYLANTEAVMFSTKKILELDKTQLLEWFDQLPSGARYRVARRVCDKAKNGALTPSEKWVTNGGANIGVVFLEWLKMKEEAQKKLRNLTETEKKDMAPKELKLMEKAAKVNTGAMNVLDIMLPLFKGGYYEREVSTALESLAGKLKLDVPVMCIADVSGSMDSHSIIHQGVEMSAKRVAQILITLFMYKNPDPDLQDILIRFDDQCEIITTGQKLLAMGQNRFVQNRTVVVDKLVDRKESVLENYKRISKFLLSRGSTNLAAVSTGLKAWVDSDTNFKSQKIEMINKYPVWMFVSDGDLNSSYTPKDSFLTFQSQMRNWFGWEGVVVLIDVNSENRSSQFENTNNFIHLTGLNPAKMNQVFTSLTDVDVVDNYVSLKTLHSSNRYTPVKELVL